MKQSGLYLPTGKKKLSTEICKKRNPQKWFVSRFEATAWSLSRKRQRKQKRAVLLIARFSSERDKNEASASQSTIKRAFSPGYITAIISAETTDGFRKRKGRRPIVRKAAKIAVASAFHPSRFSSFLGHSRSPRPDSASFQSVIPVARPSTRVLRHLARRRAAILERTRASREISDANLLDNKFTKYIYIYIVSDETFRRISRRPKLLKPQRAEFFKNQLLLSKKLFVLFYH